MCEFCQPAATFISGATPLAIGKAPAFHYIRDMKISAMSWERGWPLAMTAAAAVILAAPLWCVTVPAMPDYPAHLASFWLIGQGTDPAYFIHWHFIPNLASEILVPALARLVGLTAAAKLFLTAAVLMWVLGPAAIHRALYRRWGLAPLLGAFFAYNANFSWGFFNYYFSMGLGFIAFAGWIAWEKKTPPRLGIFALAVTAIYFCHIFAAATLLLMIASYEFARARARNGWNARGLLVRGARIAAVYVPAAIAFLLLRPHNAGDLRVEFDLADTMIDRFESLIEHNFDNPAYTLPILLFAGLAAALYFHKARLHPAMWGLLTVLFTGSLFAPEWAMGGWAVHLRMPAVFAAMLFAATELRLTLRVSRALAGAALALIAASAGAMALDWRVYDRQVAEFRAAEGAIPRGARLVTVLDGNAIGEASDQPYWHMAELAIIDRGAFTPLMFTTAGQHVIQLRAPYKNFAAATAQQGSPPDVDELGFLAKNQIDADEDISGVFPYLLRFQCHFDQALVIHLGGPRNTVPAMLRLVHAGSFFSLYNIVPDAACARR
jgi:hypothetical protein